MFQGLCGRKGGSEGEGDVQGRRRLLRAGGGLDGVADSLNKKGRADWVNPEGF